MALLRGKLLESKLWFTEAILNSNILVKEVREYLNIRCIAWMFLFQSCMAGWMSHYSFKCQPVDYSASPLALRVSFL